MLSVLLVTEPIKPKTLMEALLAVQAEVPNLKLSKNSEAQIGSRKYKFLTLDKLHDEVLPLLNRHGLVWTTQPSVSPFDGGSPDLVYELSHTASEDKLVGRMPLMLSEHTSQALGSAITYARRYALTAVVGAVADEDDDGAKASEQPTQAIRTPKPRTRRPPAPDDLRPGQMTPDEAEMRDEAERTLEIIGKAPDRPSDRPLTDQELGAMRDAIKRAGQDEYLLLAKAGVDKEVRLSHARDIRDTLDRLEGSGK